DPAGRRTLHDSPDIAGRPAPARDTAARPEQGRPVRDTAEGPGPPEPDIAGRRRSRPGRDTAARPAPGRRAAAVRQARRDLAGAGCSGDRWFAAPSRAATSMR